MQCCNHGYNTHIVEFIMNLGKTPFLELLIVPNDLQRQEVKMSML